MRNFIYRYVKYTACTGKRVDAETGDFVDFCEVLPGNFTATRATRKLRKDLKDQTITISKVEVTQEKHRMPMEQFLQLSEIVTD